MARATSARWPSPDLALNVLGGGKPYFPALDHSLDAGALALVGPAGTGKSLALVQRALRAAGETARGAVLLLSPSDTGTAKLRARVPSQTGIVCAPFGTLAFDLLRASGPGEVAEIEEARAAILFEGVGAELFSLEWEEFGASGIGESGNTGVGDAVTTIAMFCRKQKGRHFTF